MKKFVFLLLSAILILSFTCSCKEEEKQDSFEYRMDDFTSISELFNKPELSGIEGRYTVKIKGEETSVVFLIEDNKILTVRAFNKTVEVNIVGSKGYFPVELTEGKNAIVLVEDIDGICKCWIMTKDKIYSTLPEGDLFVKISVKEDGTLGYKRYWNKYVTEFSQSKTAPIELSSGRDQFLYEEGNAQILEGRLLLAPETKVELWDEYDLDAMFEEAKEQGMFTEYESVDDYFKAKASQE